MQVSKEGEKFLVDMKVYLLTKGIKEEDVNSFLEDAELHLIEGEKEGKTVTDIFGDSPKEYAQELAEEMEVDKKENWNLLISFVIATAAYWLIPELVFRNTEKPVTVSLISLIGYPIILFLMIAGMIFAFRSSSFQSKLREFSIIYVVMAVIPMVLLVGLMLLDKQYGTPFLSLSSVQSYILGFLLFVVAIIINFRLNSWIGVLTLVVLLFIMFLFEYLGINNTDWGFLEPILLYGSLALLMMWDSKRQNIVQR
ncbi:MULTISPECIES: DUF1129 domain-containing protein [unclassified Bacillus (in: firmicutes)]|uniref:DUF1129 domain-containing protein n=1 Tax=unclassified Bacillus (in: firmicutes) TaxID=185979 RepID=UPI0008E4BF0B|nr:MULTISPECIES: DUF1129 domain-containing protein [unclassified Bacillus (in: firmicutes)]SFI56138.1 Uncharacterized membrane-anchored protein [Bacillus sp. 71mf]SFS46418.1 Uncharacterized membrane-anchored protein [Bacillus sp. 103mf]